MTRANVLLISCSLVSILSVGCGNDKVAASDSQITTDIQAKLNADPTTKQATVGVAVKQGSVTLTGNVPSSDVELAALKIANATPGVHGVSDQMKVDAADATSAPMPASMPAQSGSNRSASQSSSQTMMSQATPPAQPPAGQPAPVEPAPAATAPANEPNGPAPSQPDGTPVARPVEPAMVTVAAGERLTVRTIDAIDSGKVTEGQALRASLDAPLVSRGRVVVPAGAPVTLQVTAVKGADRIKGSSELSLQATSLEYHGRNFPITTSAFEEQGKGRGRNTAIKTGIGAGLGALIGGLAGGGKGAAIGLGAGGGVGFGANALTHGQQVKIPSETVLNFKLESSLTVPISHER